MEIDKTQAWKGDQGWRVVSARETILWSHVTEYPNLLSGIKCPFHLCPIYSPLLLVFPLLFLLSFVCFGAFFPFVAVGERFVLNNNKGIRRNHHHRGTHTHNTHNTHTKMVRGERGGVVDQLCVRECASCRCDTHYHCGVVLDPHVVAVSSISYPHVCMLLPLSPCASCRRSSSASRRAYTVVVVC